MHIDNSVAIAGREWVGGSEGGCKGVGRRLELGW